MKTVLFAWELGGGFGHLASLRRYARRLMRHDIRLLAAVSDPAAAHVLAGSGVALLQAPLWPSSAAVAASASSATMGDRLASAGMADAEVLGRLLTGWDKILKAANPDLVVADFAPAAALLARGRVPLLLVGNGYTLPPAEMTHFPLLHRVAPPVWDETRILTIVNKAARAHGVPPLERLPQLFAGDARVVETFPLLDPHDLQRLEPVDGPAFDHALVAKRQDAGDILVYLARGYAIARDIIDALKPVAGRVQIYAPDLSAADRADLARAGAHVSPEPIALAEALASARLVIHRGGSGLAAHAVAAGVPQLVLGAQIEQELNGLALERAGIGKLVRSYDPVATLASAVIMGLCDDTHLAARAAQAGEAHRAFLRGSDALAAFETRSLSLLGIGQGAGEVPVRPAL